MNKRDAKIKALKIGYDLLSAESETHQTHYQIRAALDSLALQLLQRWHRMRLINNKKG